MKCVAWMWYVVVLVAAVGCGGKIDNWAEFENYGKTADAGPSDEEPQDAGDSSDGDAEAPEDDPPEAGSSGGAGSGGSASGGGSTAAGRGGAGGGSGAGEAGGGGAANPPAGGGGGSGGAPVAASCDFRGLMMQKCGSSGCHGAPATGTGLDLTSPMLAMRMGSRKGPSACDDKLMIDTNNPEESALYLKVTGNECGSMMPLGGMLSEDEQDCILSWIEGL